ncbi:futalosine hydrolase [bacterium]|nr:MAG: futalosine hydrolase [bacterium]
MNILIVSATHSESEKITSHRFDHHLVHVEVTGIGMTNTAYHLTKILSKGTFDLVLNIGICGSYGRSRPIGDVVHVIEEIFSEIGATDADGNFLDLKKMGFKHFTKDGKEYYNRILNPNKLSDFFDYYPNNVKEVRSVTVNTVNGDARRIESIKSLYDPHVENMEGGAVACVCLQEGIPFFEFRSISNYVEPRDTLQWNIPLASVNIQHFMIEFLSHLK